MTGPRLTFLYRQTDAAALAYFRVAFGALMALEMLRYLAGGMARQLWVDPAFHFKYIGFGWVTALPGDGMLYLVAALAVAALFMAVGLFYRPAALTFATGFTYLFLVEQAKYMNHFYLIVLLAWVAVFIPADAAFSLDNRRRRRPTRHTTRD